MSAAHEVRRCLLRARNAIEEAEALLEVNPAPERVQEAVADAMRRVTLAEAQAAQWCES